MMPEKIDKMTQTRCISAGLRAKYSASLLQTPPVGLTAIGRDRLRSRFCFR